MKKITSLFILTAIAGLVSFNAYAHTFDHYGFGGFGYGFGNFGYSFGGFGMGEFGGFGMGEFGGFGMGEFGGFGHGFGNFGYSFGGFDGFNHSFTAHATVPNSIRKIVPMIPAASAASSITYDENGEIRVRPFDDEDLFVED